MVELTKQPAANVIGVSDYIPLVSSSTGTVGVYQLGLSTLAVGILSQTAINTSYFYNDKGARIVKLNDRLFVGAATDTAGNANRDSGGTDWLSTLMRPTANGAWAVWGATTASLSRYGTIGMLSASRTSDAAASAGMLGYTPSTIGDATWVIDDDTSSPRQTTAYGKYIEVWRMPNVAYQPAFGMEIEAVNLGGVAVGESTPYNVNIGGGIYGTQYGVGAGFPLATSGLTPDGQHVFDGEAAWTTVANPARWRYGFIIGAGSITGADGTAATGGYATAGLLPAFHGIEWRTEEIVQNIKGANTGAFIRSVVTVSAFGSRFEFRNNQIAFSNSTGQDVFLVGVSATPNNLLIMNSGSGQQAAAVNVIQGATNGSPNLGLYPASGGEIQTSGPIVAAGASLVQNEIPAGGFWHININGVDYRIPLFTPAQAGG